MGFVVYLLIKGGREPFVVSKEGEMKFSLDLYNACLLAFIAGMFADRVFRVFRAMAGLFDRRAES